MSSPRDEERPMGAHDSSVTARSLMKALGITEFCSTAGITEIAINRPGEIWTESRHGWQRHERPEVTLDRLEKFANSITIFSKARPPLSVAAPIKPVRFPDGQRGQVAIPPACEPGTVSLTIRIPSPVRLTWEDYERSGLLDGYVDVSPNMVVPEGVTLDKHELELLDAKQERDLKRFFDLVIQHKLNVLLVGGTGSGKTTLMKMLADLVPSDVRLCSIEDTPELPLPKQPNHVHLFYSDDLPAKELVKSTLRMKFDRVYLAELRGDEAWDYLVLLNTGHQGGITTVHANDCVSAFARIADLIKQSPVGATMDWRDCLRRVQTTIDAVLFMDHHRLVQLYYDPVSKWKLQRGLA
ncbi:Type IV secretion system protein VirB11 [Ralstonia chuxiongensis]|nr:Type IV secretion system protein VirB11 [Ralstonia chuxiongensis]